MLKNIAQMPDSAENQKLCRLCGEMQLNPHEIFAANSSEKDELVKTILGFLGIQLVDDGITPNYLCQACYFAAGFTNLFMKRVLSGQKTLEHSVGQAKTAKRARTEKTDIKEPLQNVVHTQEPSNDVINRGRVKTQATNNLQDSQFKNTPKKNISKKPTVNADVPLNKSTHSDLLSSNKYISDNSDVPANISHLNPEPFADMRAADGTKLATLVFIDTEIEANRLYTIAKINKICAFCKKMFPSHLAEHNHLAYQCIDCLQSFQNKASLDKHIKETSHSSRNFNITERIINSTDSLNNSAEITENVQDHGTMTEPTTSNMESHFIA